MMKFSRLFAFLSTLLFSVALATSAHAEEPEKKKGGNLCNMYKSCNECIAGESKKVEKGEAETRCGSAATGCWVTWEKPVVCGDKEHKKKEKK